MLPSSAEGVGAFLRIMYDACALVRPPEKLSLSEWADKYGVLSAEGSSQPGKWFTSNAEYQREPMDSLSDPRYQTVVLMWASQVGKTQIALFFFAYTAHHDPGPMLFIEPTEDLCKVIVKDRIEPMIRDTPVLRDLFRSQAKSPDMFHKAFPGGQLSMGWANSPSQMASRPIRKLTTDEEGRYGRNSEGSATDQARKRLATFTNRIHARISSPALRRTCSITKGYDESDRRRYYVPCPQCGHKQTLQFDRLKGSPDACYYVCEHAGCEITEDDKYGMIRAGEWRAENPGGGDGKTAGYQLSALYSTIGYTWGEIMADYRKCAGIPDKLQVFTNTVLAEPWDEQAEGADLHEVQKRAEVYAAQAPEWVVMVTCGADVQKDRIEGTKWGWGVDDVSGVIEHRVFYGDVEKDPNAFAAFEAWRAQPVEHESGLMLPTVCTLVDSGDGNRTQAVYRYTKRHERFGVRSSKGSSQNGAPLVTRAKRVGRTQVLLVIVGTSTAKDTIYSRLGITEKDRPGYIHFPSAPEAGCDNDFYKHLTAEVLVTRQTKGGEESRWENPNRRNEALDCAVYAFAAKELTLANLDKLKRQRDAKIERLRAAGQLVARTLAVSVPSSSPASSVPLASPQAAKPAGKRRKVFRRPGAAWIQGN